MDEVDWGDYRRCRVCRAEIGERCYARSGRIVDGQPDGAAVPLTRPHKVRERRVRTRG